MKSKWIFQCTALASALATVTAPAANVVLEDFEGELQVAPAAQAGWESKGGDTSTAAISKVADAKNGSGAAAIAFDVKSGSWALVQKKVEGADWLKSQPSSITFWVKGSGSGKLEVELEESYTFKWRAEVPLADKEWHQVTLKFTDFKCKEKPAISPPDIVAIKFACFGGAVNAVVDDIQIETANP
jgi:carbohydrate binding protein with CBM11 domain